MENKILSTFSKLIGRGSGAATAAVMQRAPSKIEYLSAMRIFRDLSPEEMKMVESSTVMSTAPKGKLIFTPGETGEVLFLLKKGSVHLYRLSSEGRKLIVHTLGPMTFFGEMSMLGQNMQDLFAEAAEDCLVCAMGNADVERLILSKPQVALRMLQEIGTRLHEVQDRLGDSAFKSMRARVASLLLKLSDEGAKPIDGLRHQDLADMTGTYRETATAILNSLRDDGIIDAGRKTISILDTPKLRELADEEALRRK